MPFASARTVSLHGAVGHLIDVQADVSPGQVGTTLVGRPDTSLNESRDRVRMAVLNSDLPWPSTKRITVLLSPADLLKRGTHFDLSIAVAVLAADEKVPSQGLDGCAFVGELTLDGRLRPAAGVLPMALAAVERGVHTVFVPEPQAAEAAMVPGLTVFGVRSLAQVVAELRGEPVPGAPEVAATSAASVLAWRGEDRHERVDLGEVLGMADARYALEVAAAGGHHLMLSGPKGAGKTMLAERLPTVLPDLTPDESLELTALHSLAGVLDARQGLLTRPPYSAPHHDASKAAIVGGGSGHVRPGELSRTHLGVLFLDEFPLFRTDVLEALRQPLENGEVTVARRDELVTLPARGMLVLAANPCPCGDYDGRARRNTCQCSELKRREYRARVTGPLSDRLDITRHVRPLGAHERGDHRSPESSATVRERVERARERQRLRYDARGWRLNAHVPSAVLRECFPLARGGQELLDRALYDGRLTSRGAVRVHRLAWTVHDLAHSWTGSAPPIGPLGESPGAEAVTIALALRRGDALPATVCERRVG